MKLLQNKKTGEIGCLECSFGKTPEKITVVQYIDGKRGSRVWYYDTLAELNEEWEDYEVPKEFWYIGQDGVIFSDIDTITQDYADRLQAIGNYFESEEEAEKAVEKLKAWKRLKGKGFERVFSLELGDALCGGKTVAFRLLIDDKDSIEDIKLLFGCKE